MIKTERDLSWFIKILLMCL